MNHVHLSPKTLLAGVGLAAAVCSAAFGQAPPNNECSTAEVAILGVPAAFDTTNATPSPQPVDDSQCAGTFLNWGTSNPDVWFRWTPSSDVNVVITTCDVASFDTSLVVYTGTCAGLTQVACNGDGAGQTGCQPFYSAISLSATANTTYYIRIGGYTADGEPSDSGIGTLSIIENTAWQYACIGPAPGVPNDCAPNATVITADGNQTYYGRAGNSPTGAPCNTDGPPLTAAQCNSGADTFDLDRWYRVAASETGILRVTTSSGQPDCAGTADLKLAVFDMGPDPAAFDYSSLALPSVLVACNDDGGPCSAQFGSQVSALVRKGNSYLVRVGYYNGNDTITTGPQVVNFDLPEACALSSFTVAEDEPCGQNTNGGCNTDAAFPPVQAVNVGDVIGGTFFASPTTRDTDWFQFTIAAPAQVTVGLSCRFPANVLIVSADCVPSTTAPPSGSPSITYAIGDTSTFCPVTASACLTSGTYRVVVVPRFLELPCGAPAAENDYRLSITSVPAACPATVTSSCAAPGPYNYWVGAPGPSTGGLVACTTHPPFPDCSLGNTVRNRYARVVPASAVPDELSCVSFGVWSTQRGTNAAGTGCGFYISDIPLPATLGLYRDENGGAPTFPYEPDGTCPTGNCDLRLVNEFPVLLPGGGYLGTLNFDVPICLQDIPAGQNLVVVLDCPDLTAGVPGVPVGTGYDVRAGSRALAAGDVANTYVLFADGACGTASTPVFTLTTVYAAPSNWPILLNGTEVGCGGSACPADLNDDNFVNGDDLGILLGAWGQCGGSSCPADFNEDGFVNGDDLGVMLGAWGQCAG